LDPGWPRSAAVQLPARGAGSALALRHGEPEAAGREQRPRRSAELRDRQPRRCAAVRRLARAVDRRPPQGQGRRDRRAEEAIAGRRRADPLEDVRLRHADLPVAAVPQGGPARRLGPRPRGNEREGEELRGEQDARRVLREERGRPRPGQVAGERCASRATETRSSTTRASSPASPRSAGPPRASSASAGRGPATAYFSPRTPTLTRA